MGAFLPLVRFMVESVGNIIAEKVELTGTIRAFSEEVYETIKRHCRDHWT